MTERKKVILFQLLFVLAAVLVIEFTLRYMGYEPGNIKPNWSNFQPVDSLFVKKDFYMNNKGFMVADSAYWVNKGSHINSEGFRTHSFGQPDTTKKRVMFIGDSFTWGMSALPVDDSCFAALVEGESNYQVFNLGIPVADPVQYWAVAQKYIPVLKPDYVFVFFFMGNDLMEDDRQVIPNKPFYYSTNAGGISGVIDGIYFNNAGEAYNYIVNQKFYLQNPSAWYEKLIAKSSLLSRLYSVRFRVEEKIKFERVVKDSRLTKKYLRRIQDVARQNRVPVKFVLIPEIKDANMPIQAYKKRYSDLLLDSTLAPDWLTLQNAASNFKDYPDGHLNNQGHRLYAEFLKAFLKNTMEPK